MLRLPRDRRGLVAWAAAGLPADGGASLRGPSFAAHQITVGRPGASETGNLVCEALDESERALLGIAHRVAHSRIPTGVRPRRTGLEYEPGAD